MNTTAKDIATALGQGVITYGDAYDVFVNSTKKAIEEYISALEFCSIYQEPTMRTETMLSMAKGRLPYAS